MLLVDGTHLFPAWKNLHDWALAVRPERLTVEAHGGVHREPAGWGWTVPCDLTIRGGTWTGGTDADRGPGWWLSFRAPNTLTLDRVTVTCWTTGGIDYGDEARRHGRLVVRDSRFQRIGGSPPGYAAVYATDADVEVTGSRFWKLTQSPGEGLLHGVYLVRSQGLVLDSTFGTITGDPIRVRDGSDVNVADVKARKCGVNAVVSAWRQPTERPSHMATTRIDCGRLWDGRKSQPQYVIR